MIEKHAVFRHCIHNNITCILYILKYYIPIDFFFEELQDYNFQY